MTKKLTKGVIMKREIKLRKPAVIAVLSVFVFSCGVKGAPVSPGKTKKVSVPGAKIVRKK